jgi:hypothetical protein
MKGSGAFRWVTIALATSAVILATAAVAPARPALTTAPAHAASSCGVGRGQGFGYTYLTSLSVKGLGCASGRSVVKHRGGRGWRCAKKRLETSPVQYLERETCKSGSRQVVWTFTQDT